ncbi:hypothetical protein [Alistipes putredinis]|uniref:hypothetical protein n=1 Tax=Alistipes putredinis TaxID=28117 RepID=UPI0027BA1E60|nr:hypothetical protein [Alistipes putredinis]
MKKWVIFLILSVGFCITSVSCIKESSTFHRSVMVTNKTESAVYWAFEWGRNWDLEVPYYGYIEPDFKILPNETKKIWLLEGASSIEGMMLGKMKVFFLDADMFDKLSQGPVPAEAVLGSRIYTLEEIRAINFHFCFPFE